MIIRRKIKHNFTVMPNEFLNDESLNFETIGVLAYLLSKPDNWTVNLSHLRKRGEVGRQKMQRIMRDLIAASYVIRKPIRQGDGTVKGSEYVIYDVPQIANDRELENPSVGNRKTVNREMDLPTVGFSTSIINTDLITNTEGKNGQNQSDFPRNAFDQWYSNYPHKVAKGAGRKAFDKIQKNRQATFSQLTSGLESYIRSKPKDIPWCNPATWLHSERWADEPAAMGHQTNPQSVKPDTFTDQKWRDGVFPTVIKNRKWESAWGPPPGTSGCLAPQDLIPGLTKALEASMTRYHPFTATGPCKWAGRPDINTRLQLFAKTHMRALPFCWKNTMELI